MRLVILLVLALPLVCAPARAGGVYHDPPRMHEALEALARRFPALARLERYGRSAGGRPLEVLVLGEGRTTELAERPGLLVLGALGGTETLAAEIARATAESLCTDPALRGQLAHVTVYVIPYPDPDAAAARLRPRAATVNAAIAWDEDGDGRADEDPPHDVDGDGVVRWMRWRDPEGEWLVDPKAASDGERRLLRRADPTRGEAGRYRLAREGADLDLDGQFAEDGPGGIAFDRSFPLGFADRRHEPHAGAVPLARPAARALADFLVSHRSIAAAYVPRCGWSEGPHGIERTRLHGAGGALDPEMKSLYAALRDTIRERTGEPDRAAPYDDDKAPTAGGTLLDWLVFGHGIVAWSEPLWLRPPELENTTPTAAPKPATATATPDAPRFDLPVPGPAPAANTATARPAPGQAASGPAPRRAGPGPSKALELQRAWLRWNDRVLGGRGFVPWHRVPHPQLGAVEVGGWRPRTIETPPEPFVAAICAREVTVTAVLLERLPRLAFDPPRLRALAEDVWELEVGVRNTGGMPTATPRAARNGTARRPVLTLSLPHRASLVFGERRRLLPRLLPGARASARWVVRAPRGSRLRLEAHADRAGRSRLDLTLQER